MRYRTEIVIPPDRYVCVQLPTYLPEGKAVVTIYLPDRDDGPPNLFTEIESDRQDIEWWDEFEEDRRSAVQGEA